MELIIGLLGGAIGGNVAGSALERFNLGTVMNSVAGIIGGGIGGTILSKTGTFGVVQDVANASGMDMNAILAHVSSGGVGGAVVLLIIGLVRDKLMP